MNSFLHLIAIIFHSGYTLDSSHFFDNIGAVQHSFGSYHLRSSLEVHLHICSKAGLISGMNKEPFRSLLFGR
jgi:hypothetical protein